MCLHFPIMGQELTSEFSSFGSLSDHQPGQRLQKLQFYSLQDCGRKYMYSRISGIARHLVHNSLQFFQWLVMLQCSGQSYGSSASQIIVSEAAVRWNQTRTHLSWSHVSFAGGLSWIPASSYFIETGLKRSWLAICCSISSAALWSSSQWNEIS